jgi:hypothetical protein
MNTDKTRLLLLFNTLSIKVFRYYLYAKDVNLVSILDAGLIFSMILHQLSMIGAIKRIQTPLNRYENCHINMVAISVPKKGGVYQHTISFNSRQ